MSKTFQVRGVCETSMSKRPHRFQKIKRMLKARVGQFFDRRLFSALGGLGAKLSHPKDNLARLEAADDFDTKYGIDTSGILQPWDIDIPDGALGQANLYESAPAGTFTELLASLSIEHEQYSFVDLGSGKGRSLLLASRFPFRQIVGVELSPQLQAISSLNIMRFRAEWQRCSNIAALCMNAREFTIPAGNVVLYLFNPFGEETLRAVVSNMESSLLEKTRRIYVIYVKPIHRSVLDQSNEFSLFRAVGHDLIYTSKIPALVP